MLTSAQAISLINSALNNSMIADLEGDVKQFTRFLPEYILQDSSIQSSIECIGIDSDADECGNLRGFIASTSEEESLNGEPAQRKQSESGAEVEQNRQISENFECDSNKTRQDSSSESELEIYTEQTKNLEYFDGLKNHKRTCKQSKAIINSDSENEDVHLDKKSVQTPSLNISTNSESEEEVQHIQISAPTLCRKFNRENESTQSSVAKPIASTKNIQVLGNKRETGSLCDESCVSQKRKRTKK